MLPVGIEISKIKTDVARLVGMFDGDPNWSKAKTVGASDSRSSGIINLLAAAEVRPEVAKALQDVKQEFSAALADYKKTYKFAHVRGAESCSMLRYGPGQEYRVHADHAPALPRVVSGIIYLNEDFEGGELEFPLLNYTYKPKAGDLVLFPSNYIYAHAAKPVTSGVRYCVVTFFI